MPNKPATALFSPQLIFILAIIAGTLGWEVLGSILALSGLELDLSTGPVGFDAKVLSLYMEVNPGTFLGLFFGYRFAKSVAAPSGRSRRKNSASRKAASGDGGTAGRGAAGGRAGDGGGG